MNRQDSSHDNAKRSGIQLQNVSFFYGKTEIFKSLSLSIPEGEIWAVVGRSGAGKTTLVHLVAGLFTPMNGEITISGRMSGPGSIRGVVFQEDSLLGWLSIEENMLFPFNKLSDPSRSRAAREMLEAVGLAGKENDSPQTFSSGMRKRVEFARALLADGDYILADEPFGTVDAVTRRDLWRLWLDLHRLEPRTGILCTHDPEEAVRLCDAVVTLSLRQPSTVSQNIKIPESVRQLDVNSESKELWTIKRKVIQSLHE